MELIVLGSSSRGNCYLIRGIAETLVIEAGVPWNAVLNALDFDLSSVKGCLITHEHGDHANHMMDFVKAGINVYSSRGTIMARKQLPNHRISVLEPFQTVQVGQFVVMGFPVVHDAREPFGFLINHHECGTVAFITDSSEIRFSLPGLNNLIVEANFAEDLAERSTSIPEFVKNRIRNSHMEIGELKSFLRMNDTTKLNNIVLIHLSQGNSDSKRFHEEVSDIMPGKQVWIAEPGMRIQLNKRPF